MKKIIGKYLLIAFAILATLQLGQAQSRGGFQNVDPQTMANRQTEQMADRLDLNEEQTEQISVINLKYSEQMLALRGTDGSRSEKMAALQTMQAEKDEELKAVLTEEQWASYEKMRDEGMSKLRGRLGQKGF